MVKNRKKNFGRPRTRGPCGLFRPSGHPLKWVVGEVGTPRRARSTQANFDLGHRLFLLRPVLLRPGAT